ncbi:MULTISPECIES: hypothetical protein [Vibrio harveyi group]|uniref:hypothetical protein n=1 Tax=Vibrio harveyi group TaxID=717610 RepID=UPI00111062D1|nr:hypothetical protein [Vibrio parahaemolyticus]MDG2761601.1 hypothetical protein [Vibrio parahaemolyticus]TMX40852.1 hypothetical protein DA098_03205 [Vibrio parahaemolyticus]TMX79843.1 hypothetical protein DA094_04995 [Vibrio parahaemolyticus]
MKIGLGRLGALIATKLSLKFGRHSDEEAAHVDVQSTEKAPRIDSERVTPIRVKRSKPVKAIVENGRTRKQWYSPDSPEVKAMVAQQKQKQKQSRGNKK